MLEYLSDPRDRAVLSAAPTLMQPLHGNLPPVPLNTHRYVAARDGLYLQARTVGLDVCKRIAPMETGTLPYGPLREWVRLPGGRLPSHLYQEVLHKARAASPNEWACLILYDPACGYRLHEPAVDSCSAGHIRYLSAHYDPEQVVVDLHTHGTGKAFFSATDDADDRVGGIYIAVVLGTCGPGQSPTQAMRLAVHGHLLDARLALWADPGDVPGRCVFRERAMLGNKEGDQWTHQ